MVPAGPTEAMQNAGREYEAEHYVYDVAPDVHAIYQAMLSAAATDWSAHAVRVPEPQIDKRIFDTEDQKAAWTDGWLSAIFALDAILGAK